MLPDPTCVLCVEGAALQAAGALPAGVPFCLEHELPDVAGGGEVSARGGLLERMLRRWQLRVGESLFGWALPFVALVLALAGAVRLWVRWPRTSTAVAAAGAVWWLSAAHPGGLLIAVAAAVQVGAVWPLLRPDAARLRALGWVRSLLVYRRLWATAMHAAQLTRRDEDGQVQRPRFRRVRCRESVDVVHVRGLVGQRFHEWEEAAGMLGHVFGARGVRVHRGDDRRLTIELVRGRRGRSWNRDGALDLEAAV